MHWVWYAKSITFWNGKWVSVHLEIWLQLFWRLIDQNQSRFDRKRHEKQQLKLDVSTITLKELLLDTQLNYRSESEDMEEICLTAKTNHLQTSRLCEHASPWAHISVCSVLTAGDGGVCGRAQSGVHLCRGGLQSGARVHRRLHLPLHARQGPERVSRRGDVLQADQRLDLSAATLTLILSHFFFFISF